MVFSTENKAHTGSRFHKSDQNAIANTQRDGLFFGDKTAQPFFSPNTGVQAKLTIGAPDDAYEKEADATAEKVVQRLSEPAPVAQSGTVQAKSDPIPVVQRVTFGAQRKCATCEKEEELQKKEEERQPEEKLQRKPIFDSPPAGTDDERSPNVQRKCAACEKEEQAAGPLQRQANAGATATATDGLSARLQSSKGGGSALPPDLGDSMGHAMGADFSGVRVHTGSEAAVMSQSIHAQAFTHGQDIYFNEGKYNPGSTDGQKLLAHELTHTVQQGGAGVIRRSSSRGAGGCGPPGVEDENLDGAKAAGLAAHTQIQSYLALSGINSEVAIPRGTKRLMVNQGCQPEGVRPGFADLFKPGFRSQIGEIKPYPYALQYGVPQVEHYILRGRQSLDRFHRSGPCSNQPKGTDDESFVNSNGLPISMRGQFTKMSGILNNDTTIGQFEGDTERTLKARLVTPGVVGYWCTGKGSDTYICGCSQQETDAYIDRMLLPAQGMLEEFLRDSIERPIEAQIDHFSIRSVIELAQEYFGSLLGPEISNISHFLPPGISIDDLIRMGDQAIGPVGRNFVKLILRKLKSIIINKLRILLRNSLRQMIQETLVTLCVGVPIVTYVTLMEALKQRIRQQAMQLIPVLIETAVAAMMGEIIAMIYDSLATIASALRQAFEFLAWLLGELFVMIAKILAILLIIIFVLAALILFVVGLILLFLTPGPPDEAIPWAGAAALILLIPMLWHFVTGGDNNPSASPESA